MSGSLKEAGLKVSYRKCSISSDNEENISPCSVVFVEEFSVSPQVVLASVLNNLFLSVLVHLNETIRKNILNEFWRMVPLELVYRINFSDGEPSVDVIISAFEEAELRHSGTCKLFLQGLANLRNVPFVADSVSRHINQTYPGKVFVSNSVLPPNRSTSRMSYVSTCDSEQASIYNDNNAIQPKTSRREEGYTICGYLEEHKQCVMSILRLEGRIFTPYSTPATERYWNNSYSRPTSAVKRARKKFKIAVQSYTDYQNAMFKIPFESEIDLSISLQGQTDWPANAALGNAHMVTKLRLEGKFGIEILLNILKGMTRLKNLVLSGNDQMVCATENISRQLQRNKITLPHLTALYFENFQECSMFYKIFSKKVVFKNLHTFKIVSSVVTTANREYLQCLIVRAKDCLSILEFPDTSWQTTFFENQLGILSKLETLRVDFLTDSKHRLRLIDAQFRNVFPNLKVFSSVSGYLSIDHFVHLSVCKALTAITIGLRVAGKDTKVNIYDLVNMFPHLREADISLNYENNESGCTTEGITEALGHLEKLTFSDNCLEFATSIER